MLKIVKKFANRNFYCQTKITTIATTEPEEILVISVIVKAAV